MKKYGIYIVFIFLISCATTYHYNYELKNLDTINKDNINIEFNRHWNTLELNIKNNTKYTIKVLWEEATIDNSKIEVGKWNALGAEFNYYNRQQPPSIIPPNSYISRCVIPENNITKSIYDKYSHSTPNTNVYGFIANTLIDEMSHSGNYSNHNDLNEGLNIISMFPEKSKKDSAIKPKTVNKEISIPLMINDNKIVYKSKIRIIVEKTEKRHLSRAGASTVVVLGGIGLIVLGMSAY